MSEAEAQAIRFTIDHYEPQRSRADLVNEYGNLMYCCEECNLRKGDRSPPAAARVAGSRFFRPDADEFDDHFELNDLRLNAKSPTGEYSIDALDLNRAMLRKLRDCRRRMAIAEKGVAAGMRALRDASLDQLPPHIRGQALATITKAVNATHDLRIETDRLLSELAKSPLLDQEPETDADRKARTARLKALEALYPGIWRGRNEPAK